MTNPDTNTLNGALEQLGITMAENLVTMGVSDADPSDGLTTLAGKILSISPTPTPTVDSLTLVKTAGKQILSYADSGATPETEYCTLTATALDSNNQGVSGQSVVFKVGSSTVATETTDSNGEASYTYVSAGSGDVVLSAECSSLIQTYAVEDCNLYLTSLPSMSQSTIASNFYKDTFTTPYNLPNGDFVIELGITRSNNYALINAIYGESISDYYYSGLTNDGRESVAIARNNNRAEITTVDSSKKVTLTTSIPLYIKYQNGTHTVDCNNITHSATNTEHNNTYFLGLMWGRQTTVNYIKIKPL